MRLAKDGLAVVAAATLVLLGAAAGAVGLADWAWWGWLIAVPLLAVWLWVLWFFRDPQRVSPSEPGLFVSPADGTITDITPIGPESPLGCEGVKVGLFMSIFSVHVNRAPCSGTVQSVHHRPGRFVDARKLESSELNESVTVHLEHEAQGQRYPVVYRQVAGLVARRIVCRVEPGQSLERGQRVGMIRFGSRAELLLPASLEPEVLVRIGQSVQGGLTVMARAGAGGGA